MDKKTKSFYGFRERGIKSKYQSFALEITAGCQLQCGNCYREPGCEISPMPGEFVVRMIKEARENGFSEIVFIGGEPTLHPQLPDFIYLTLKEGMTPILCTNGERLSDMEYCKKVLLPGTTVVIHGLLSLPINLADKHVGSKGYVERLKRAYKNIEMSRSRGITIVAEAVVINIFMDYLLGFHAWCRANEYIPFIEINRRGNNGIINSHSSSPDDVYKLFKKIQNWDSMYAPDLIDNVLTPPAYGTKCTMSITGIHIKNFGKNNYSKIYSCCAQTVCHGDLEINSLDTLMMDNPGMDIFKNQDEWIVGPCLDCEYYSICRGGCRGEAALAFGCPRASCPACWHIPENIRLDPTKMMPKSCSGCPLENSSGCSPKR